jgi:hypothetical protein
VITALVTVVLAVALAAALLVRHRVTAPLRPTLDALRALHSGRVGDAVGFLALGVATLGTLFSVALR